MTRREEGAIASGSCESLELDIFHLTCHAFEGSRSSQHNDNAPALHRVFHKLMRASNIG
jgi:hypothetical protein